MYAPSHGFSCDIFLFFQLLRSPHTPLLHRLCGCLSLFSLINNSLNLTTFEHIQEQLQDDIGRVDGLFEKALEAGISIQVCVSTSYQHVDVMATA